MSKRRYEGVEDSPTHAASVVATTVPRLLSALLPTDNFLQIVFTVLKTISYYYVYMPYL